VSQKRQAEDHDQKHTKSLYSQVFIWLGNLDTIKNTGGSLSNST